MLTYDENAAAEALPSAGNRSRLWNRYNACNFIEQAQNVIKVFGL